MKVKILMSTHSFYEIEVILLQLIDHYRYFQDLVLEENGKCVRII